MKHIVVFFLQVVYLWFEDFDLEDTQLCTRDFITLQDSLGIIGKSGINPALMGYSPSQFEAFVNTVALELPLPRVCRVPRWCPVCCLQVNTVAVSDRGRWSHSRTAWRCTLTPTTWQTAEDSRLITKLWLQSSRQVNPFQRENYLQPSIMRWLSQKNKCRNEEQAEVNVSSDYTYPWSVCVKLKYPSSSPPPEIVEAGGVLQGDQGSVMTPGFPEQNYKDGALYQVHRHTPESGLENGVAHLRLGGIINTF